MDMNIENNEWASLSYAEKNRALFIRQKKTLEMFLDSGAISKKQYDKSLREMEEKMGVTEAEGK